MKNLNGKWNYIKDKNSIFSIEQIKEEIKKNNYSGKIDVPSNWNSKKLSEFSGTLWYVKKIKIPKSNKRKKIHFSGIDYFADVWFNWNFIGSHEGYFQSFDFILDEKIIKANNNILVVKVTSPVEEAGKVWPDNKQLVKGIFNHHDCRPGGCSKKHGQDRNTGGIWNNVEIIYEKDVIINDIKISPKISKANVRLKIELKYSSSFSVSKSSLVLFSIKSGRKRIHKEKIKILFKPKGKKTTVDVILKNYELWFPWELGAPVIISLKISSSLFNEVTVKFGIREVSLSKDNEFFINGKKLFLRGTNIIPEQYLSKLTSSKIKALIYLLKEANVNIVRVHAHVNRHELYSALDEAGILVWQDFALQWTYEESDKFRLNAVKQIKDMVNQFYNHPSIVFWCCHNEPGEQIKNLDEYLFDAVTEEDNTRIIRIASNYEEHPYDGWYWGKSEHFIATPMGPLVTEFGAQALPEYNSLKKIISNKDIKELNWDKWEYHNFQYEQTFNVAGIEIGSNIKEFIEASQKYQAELIETAIDYYRRKKWNGITGIFQFMFIDGWESISWSVVDYFGRRKKGYFALQKVYAPLYLSIDLKKKRYQNGSELFMELYIINDLQVKLQNVHVEVYLNESKIIVVNNIDVEPDSVCLLSADKFKTEITSNVKISTLRVLLINSPGEKIAEASKNILLINEYIKWE